MRIKLVGAIWCESALCWLVETWENKLTVSKAVKTMIYQVAFSFLHASMFMGLNVSLVWVLTLRSQRIIRHFSEISCVGHSGRSPCQHYEIHCIIHGKFNPFLSDPNTNTVDKPWQKVWQSLTSPNKVANLTRRLAVRSNSSRAPPRAKLWNVVAESHYGHQGEKLCHIGAG